MGYCQSSKILFDETVCKEQSPEVKRFYDNYRLAWYVAKPYLYPKDVALDADDIIQEAFLQLWKCCKNFDESRGYQFSTYAGSHMKFHILKYLRDDGEPIKTPRYFKRIVTIINKHGFTFPLNDDEIDVLLMDPEIDIGKLERFLNFSVTSLDKPVNLNDDELSLSNLIADKHKEAISDEQIDEIIDIIASKIKPERRSIITEWMSSVVYDENPITQTELAVKYGISQAQVSRVLRNCINIIKFHKDEILDIVGAEPD